MNAKRMGINRRDRMSIWENVKLTEANQHR